MLNGRCEGTCLWAELEEVISISPWFLLMNGEGKSKTSQTHNEGSLDSRDEFLGVKLPLDGLWGVEDEHQWLHVDRKGLDWPQMQ